MSIEPKRKVAIFDIDGTIFRSSLLIELVEVFIEKGIFLDSVHREYEQEKISWLNREGGYHDYIMGVVGVFMRNIKGVTKEEYMNAVNVVMERYKSRTYIFTKELIAKLKAEGYFLLAISYSPKNILDSFCKELGFDKVYGKLYEIDDEGVFTGVITDDDFISDKALVLNRAVEKENLTLENSVGVGDTESDIKFLSLVSRPICFNPNMNLWNHAKEVAWEVIVERKDVVYEIPTK